MTVTRARAKKASVSEPACASPVVIYTPCIDLTHDDLSAIALLCLITLLCDRLNRPHYVHVLPVCARVCPSALSRSGFYISQNVKGKIGVNALHSNQRATF